MATSPHLTVITLTTSAFTKGIDILGTGDCTHPAWYAELREHLEPAEPGMYRLKEAFLKPLMQDIPDSCKNREIRFVPTVEISTIFTRENRVRKIHSVVVLSDLALIEPLQNAYARFGNLEVDGRPTLLADIKDIMDITLTVDPLSLFIPAHIWTPWFGVFGSKAGFDSLEEAFGPLAQYVYAIESGLDSDPGMNHHASDVGTRSILSHSDAHSSQKLGREATIFDIDFSYPELYNAIKTNNDALIGTIEFFPEEGKYHFDGHRKCDICISPQESRSMKNVCPVCGKALTLGVQNRVEKLTHEPSADPVPMKTVEYIVPLSEIFMEIHGVKSSTSQSVQNSYTKAIALFGNEFDILRTVSIDDIATAGFPELSRALSSMRNKNVSVTPGYDGVFGKVNLLGGNHTLKESPQLSLDL